MTGLAKNLDISEAIWGLLSSRKYLLPSVFIVSAALFPNGSFAGNFDGLPDGGKVDYGNVIIKKNNKGATSKKALILFFLSAFLRLTSKGIPSVVKICFVSELINKKGGYK